MTLAVPFWNDDPQAWDGLVVATTSGAPIWAPGIVDDVDIDNDVKIDERDASGQNGATLGFNGAKLAKVTIKLRIWNKVQFARIAPLLAEIKPSTKGATPKAHDYSHPLLALWGLSSLLYLSAKGPTQPGVKGISYLTLKLIEFAPPPKKGASAPITTSSALAGFSNTLSAVYGSPGTPDSLRDRSRFVVVPNQFDATLGAYDTTLTKPSAGGSSP